MKKGNRYEFNSTDKLQFILEVIKVDGDVVLFKGYEKEFPETTFETEPTISIVNDKIKRHEIALIE